MIRLAVRGVAIILAGIVGWVLLTEFLVATAGHLNVFWWL